MTIERLEAAASIRGEIKELEKRIAGYESMIVSDTVHGSSEFPYEKRTITVVGIERSAAARALRLRTRLKLRKEALDGELEQVEIFLDSLGDSALRRLIQLRYIDGFSWTAASNRVFGYPCESRARMKVKRFFEKI